MGTIILASFIIFLLAIGYIFYSIDKNNPRKKPPLRQPPGRML